MENTDSIGEWRRVFAILLSVGSVLFTIPWLAVSALGLWQVSADVFEGGELLMAAIFLTFNNIKCMVIFWQFNQ